MLVGLSKQWTYKPPQGVQINYGHPLSQGIYAFVPMLEAGGLNTSELVKRQFLSSLNHQAWNKAELGFGRLYGAYSGSPAYDFLVDTSLIAAPFTVVTKFLATTTTAAGIVSCGNAQNEGSPSFYVVWNKNSGKIDWFFGGTYHTGTITVAINTWYTVALTFDGTTWNCYINGNLDATAAVAIAGNRNNWYIGEGFAGAIEGTVEWAGVWHRTLTIAQIRLLGIRPYDILVPQAPRPRIWQPAVAGGGTVDLPELLTDDLNSGPWLDAAILNESYQQLASDTLNVPWADALLLNESYEQPGSDSFTLTDSNALNESYELPQNETLNLFSDSLDTFGAWFFTNGDTLSITDQDQENLGYWVLFNDSENNWADSVAEALGAALVDLPLTFGDVMLFTDDNGKIQMALVYGPSIIDLNYLRRYLNDVINGGIDINL